MREKRLSERGFSIGITGSIACGKSTVMRIFKKLGCFSIDADKLAKRLLKKKSPVYDAIVKRFGKSILKKDRSISRKILAKIVFNDRAYLKFLNNLIHPLVISKIKDEIKKKKDKITVAEVPLLFERGFDKFFDKIVVVKADKEIALKRALKKGINKNDFLRRLKAQMPLKEKLKRADFIIDNNRSMKKTEKQIKRILESLKKE